MRKIHQITFLTSAFTKGSASENLHISRSPQLLKDIKNFFRTTGRGILLFKTATLGLLMCHHSAEITGHFAGPHPLSNPPRHAETFCPSQIKIRKPKPRSVTQQFSLRKPQRSLPKPGQLLPVVPNKSYWKKRKTLRPPYLDVTVQKRLAVTKNKANACCDNSWITSANDHDSPSGSRALGEVRKMCFPTDKPGLIPPRQGWQGLTPGPLCIDAPEPNIRVSSWHSALEVKPQMQREEDFPVVKTCSSAVLFSV